MSDPSAASSSSSSSSGPLTTAAPTVVTSVNGAVVTTSAPSAEVKVEPGASAAASSSSSSAASSAADNSLSAAANQVLDRRRLQELVKEVDVNEQLDEDVEDLLLHIADDFIEQTVSQAAQLAKHRKASTVDVKDVQMVLGEEIYLLGLSYIKNVLKS